MDADKLLTLLKYGDGGGYLFLENTVKKIQGVGLIKNFHNENINFIIYKKPNTKNQIQKTIYKKPNTKFPQQNFQL